MPNHVHGVIIVERATRDPALGKFIQADMIVPGGVQGLDRYAYSYNNPVKYIDPSGHKPCQWGDPDPACNTYSDMDYHLDQQIEQPDAVCRKSNECYQSYLTYKELVWMLHYVPSIEQILYMTAQTEGYSNKESTYYGSGTFEGSFLEGLARNYYQPYEACNRGSPTCTESKLYKFMSGYQPWFDSYKSVNERATYLRYSGMNNDTFRSDLELATSNITNPDYARFQGWMTGMWKGEPWQWHNWTRPPGEGEALGWIYLPTSYGNYFWIMTADQTIYFQNKIDN